MSESDSEYLRRMGRDIHMRQPRGLVPQGKAFTNIADRIDATAAALEQATTEVGRLGKLVYLAGHWSCPKCDFYLVSTNLHVPSGGFSANREPQACANGCGPMWRVTHEQSANTMVDRCEKQTDRIEQLEAAGQRSLQWLASYPGGCCLGAYQQMTEVLEPAILVPALTGQKQ